MKQVAFEYDVFVEIEFDSTTIDYLIGLSSRHYDSKCRRASKVGGFLYGMRNMLALGVAISTATRRMTGDELGTLQKIAEMGEDAKIRNQLVAIQNARIEEWKRISEWQPDQKQ